MTNNKELKTNCIDCGHYILQQGSVHVDIENDVITATANYICEKGFKPNFIEYCAAFYKAQIEDTIVWKRGWRDEDD
jgi:hypothetical protein